MYCGITGCVALHGCMGAICCLRGCTYCCHACHARPMDIAARRQASYGQGKGSTRHRTSQKHISGHIHSVWLHGRRSPAMTTDGMTDGSCLVAVWSLPRFSRRCSSASQSRSCLLSASVRMRTTTTMMEEGLKKGSWAGWGATWRGRQRHHPGRQRQQRHQRRHWQRQHHHRVGQ